MAFTLPELGYDYGALGDYISADIMKLHHDNHHQTYVDKLNAALEPHAELQNKTIDQLLSELDKLPDDVRTAVRNNGGGHYNHSLFWKFMTPDGGGQPSGDLLRAISQTYGSFQNFVDEFTKSATGLFGSGWVWLLQDMSIAQYPLQDSPIMRGLPEPLLGLDVWEHAYYLDYKYKRPDYVAAWWNTVDWHYVSSRLIEV